MAENKLITVKELKEHIANLPDDANIFFGCVELEFFRVKRRGDNVYQVEFNQTVYKNSKDEVIVE